MAYQSEQKTARKNELLAQRASRTNEQQLALLDKRLGKNQGAKRERDRLNGIVKEKVAVVVVEVVEVEQTVEEKQAEKDAAKAAKKAYKASKK